MIKKGYHFDIICGILTHGVTKQHKSDLRFPDISDGQAVLLQEIYLCIKFLTVTCVYYLNCKAFPILH